MPPISDVVNVTIGLESSPATRAGFGVALIAGDSDKLPKYDIVTLTFSAELVASNVINGKVNGVAISQVTWNTNNDTTMGLLATELQSKAAITSAVASDVGAVGYDNTITCTAADEDTILALTDFLVTLGASQATITVARTPFRRTKTYANLAAVAADFATTDSEYIAASWFFAQSPNPGSVKIGRIDSGADWSDELDEIVKHDNDWYALCITDRTLVDQTDVAAWAKTKTKIFFLCSADTDILDSGVSSDIASVIQTAVNHRAAALYHETAATAYPEAGWMAIGLAQDPGSLTWAYKTIVQPDGVTGLTPSTISATQRAAAQAKNCNLYETYGSRDIVLFGKVGGSATTGADYIDVTRGIDWQESDMSTRVFDLLGDSLKVPYTNSGLAQIEAEIRVSLDEGIASGLLVADPDSYEGQPYRVTVADVSTIAAAEKAARNVPSTALTFQAQLAGAVHKVNIAGTVVI